MQIDEQTLGKNVIYIDKHLHEFQSGPHSIFFDKTILCGDLARLMAQLRRQEVLSVEKFEVMAAEIDINPYVAREVHLPIMENLGYVRVHRDNAGRITKIEEYIPPREEDIIKRAGELWVGEQTDLNIPSLAKDPHDIEKLTVIALELCSQFPKYESELKNELSILGIKSDVIVTALDWSEKLNILSKYEDPEAKEAIVASEYVFGENAIKIRKAIDHLPEHIKSQILGVYEETSKRQGLPEKFLSGGSRGLIKQFGQIGLFEPVSIETAKRIRETFLFTPRMWSTLKRVAVDLYDEVKLYIASIRFGQHFADIRIFDPVLLTEALLRDGVVGPATPIGTDYILLERRGIVRIIESQIPNRYYMELLKKEIVEIALDVLKCGYPSPLKDINVEWHGMTQLTHGYSPEQVRIRLKRQNISPPEQITCKLLRLLRGGL